MLKMSSPVGAIGIAFGFLLSAAGTGLSIDSARAEACLAAPKTAAPSGQHWYYHFVRATRRKCWYLHATVQPGHRAAIRHHAAEAAAAADSQPAGKSQTAIEPQAAAGLPVPPASAALADPPAQPVASPTAPRPDGPGSGAVVSAPHVTVLTVRPSTPFVTATATPQQSSAAVPHLPPAVQPSGRKDDASAVGGAKPADAAQPAQLQDRADAAATAPVKTADTAADTARTKAAEMFILLALVFGAAAAVIALVSKILGIYRRPRISDDPDAAWLRYRSARQRIDAEAGYDERGVPFVDPEEHYGLADLHEQEWLDRSSPPRNGSPASRSRSNPSDIEPALRALRQARQSRVG